MRAKPSSLDLIFALGYVIPSIRDHSGLAPVRQCSCRAYEKGGYIQ